MKLSAEFTDPRLVAIYDSINSYEPGTQPDFYLGLAEDLAAESILDVGCGTGLITCRFGERGYRTVGLDPSEAMIERARSRDTCSTVDWRVGDVESVDRLEVDLAVMTGHVAQFFISDNAWSAALEALARSLRVDGWLAFESRNPGAREWERWKRTAAQITDDPEFGPIDHWSESRGEANGVVSYSNHYVFHRSGEEISVSSQLRFRSEHELRDSLASHGFQVSGVLGDWDGRPADTSSSELIVVARASRSR